MSIPISKKHGVNPTIPVCFFCGKEKNEIALLGKLKNDAEAPMYCVIDYIPCDECKAKMDKGITLLGVTDYPTYNENQPPITKGPLQSLYPTSTWAVVTEDFIKRLCGNDTEQTNNIINARRTLIEQNILSDILAQNEKLKGNKN